METKRHPNEAQAKQFGLIDCDRCDRHICLCCDEYDVCEDCGATICEQCTMLYNDGGGHAWLCAECHEKRTEADNGTEDG